jgi:hypothetical protein
VSEELFEKYLARRLSPGESLELSVLLEDSAEAREALVVYAQEWQLLAEVSRTAEAAALLESGRETPGELRAPDAAPVVIVTPVLPAAPGRSRRAYWIAAAALLAALGGWALYAGGLFGRRETEGPRRQPRPVVLASGTKVLQGSGCRAEILSGDETAEDVIRLEAGEVAIAAAAAPGDKAAVRVETDLGVVETLGTRFTVRYENSEGDQPGGGLKMISERTRATTLAAALLVVSVFQGRVLVTGELGQMEVVAGETAELGPDKATVGAVDRVIKARVTDVRKGSMGGYVATLGAGRRDGVKVGFEFTCEGKWTGRVRAVEPTSAVLEVDEEVTVGDVAATRFSTVDAIGEQPVPAKEAAVVKGLRLNLIKDVQIFKRGGGRAARVEIMAHGGGMKPQVKKAELPARPAGGTWQRVSLWAELENTTDKPILLPGDDRRIVLAVRAADGDGNEILMSPNYRSGQRTVNWPETITVLQPGEKARKAVSVNGLQFPGDGTYRIWVEYQILEVDAPRDVPCWTGEIKSGTIDWVIDYHARQEQKRQLKGR